MTVANPFQPAPGASPPTLVGREGEEASIADAVDRAARKSAPTPLAFLGLRGIGKTALLNALRNAAVDHSVPLAIESQKDVPLSVSIASAMVELVRQTKPLSKRLGGAIEDALASVPLPSFELPHEMGAISFKAPARRDDVETAIPMTQALSNLALAVAAQKKYLMLTIDELHNADITSLRAIIAIVHQSASTPSPILFACAGLPQTQAIFDQMNTYVKRWDIFELMFLTRSDSVRGIREPSRSVGVEIHDAVVDAIVEEAAGYPFFLQKYASAAWRHVARGRLEMSHELEQTLIGTRLALERTYYAKVLEILPIRERLFVLALADLGPGAHELASIARQLGIASAAALGSTRMRLIKKDVLFVPMPGTVQFRIPLTDRYVRRNRETLVPLTAEKKGEK